MPPILLGNLVDGWPVQLQTFPQKFAHKVSRLYFSRQSTPFEIAVERFRCRYDPMWLQLMTLITTIREISRLGKGYSAIEFI